MIISLEHEEIISAVKCYLGDSYDLNDIKIITGRGVTASRIEVNASLKSRSNVCIAPAHIPEPEQVEDSKEIEVPVTERVAVKKSSVDMNSLFGPKKEDINE